ncbi:ABC transporter substrate-binding protein [Parasporobacterium paucivorans]|uniref:Iron complex transport system substrate-binding protein n=1 Tax=Parasporobacterium paucivorans DSM 15970 TaxID=1122934 RepID=A0A1M6EL11_9FIRM|nr:ABC transporter substrate-binding protein [Parasporobacterium paucivorans]SHI86086.1 iron complex transport system substrate-binding protein [Parasporobacterium paucivorans DSM 15970]
MKKRIIGMILILAMVVAMAAGCGQSSGEAKETKSAETTSAVEVERPSVDMAGRAIVLPEAITSVYCSGPIGTNYIYTFDDTLLAVTNYELSDAEKMYTTQYYQNLPNLGGWYGKGNEGNVEEIIKTAPDIVICTGTDEASIAQADALQAKLGIQVVNIDSSFEAMADSYRFLGALLGNAERGEELAAYTEETINHAKEIAASIPEEKKVSVYYAEEQLGLNTDPSGSEHSRLIDLCGGINVADCEITKGYGRTEVSMEQIISWDPQYIISCVDNGNADSASYNTIMNDSQWSVIQAVKDGHVYQTPSVPQNWFDRPPSVNTIIGVKWCQSILYPEMVDYDIKEEAKTFYSLFYHYDLTDKETESLLENSL